MMRCKSCNHITARMVTKRELKELSKKHYKGPLAAAAAVVATAAAKTVGSNASAVVGLAAKGVVHAAKAATKGPKEMLVSAGIAAAVTASGYAVKHFFDKRAAGDKTYAYCARCGHYEPMA